MAFGVEITGFNLKRFEDIKSDVEEGLREQFGEINTDSESAFGQIIGVFSRQMSEVWEQMENVYNAMYPATAEGTQLDNSADLVGVDRLSATFSTAVVIMKGVESTVVPISTLLSQSTTKEVFANDVAATITVTKNHEAQAKVVTAADSTLYTITVNGTAITFLTGIGATAASIISVLVFNINNDPTEKDNVTAVQADLADDFMTITVKDPTKSATTFSLVVDANMSIPEFWSPMDVNADIVGAKPVPVNTIDTIDTPVSGLNEVKNIAVGVTGRELESDVAFRERRRISLAVIAAATVFAIQSRLVQELGIVTAAFVFENRTDIWSAKGKTTITYDADFVASNSITFNINDQSITPVVFATSHIVTVEALRAAIQGLSGVETATRTDIGGNDRTIEVITPIFNETLFRTTLATSIVTLGASQAVATVVQSNTGRPPHSFEAVVAAENTGPNIQAIGDQLFKTKAAGIQSHGDESADVLDSNGDIQKIGFTFAKTRFVHLELDYDRTDADKQFPLDGEAQILAEILRIGALLTFGDDILVQQFEGAAYITIGITNVIVRLATTPNAGDTPTFGTINIPILASELPDFNSTRIKITDITP